MPDLGEDADAPIIIPRPGQILRRTARTKIRKHGQTGEGAHRFNATRRGAGAKRDTPPPVPEPRTSSDLSTSDHSDAEPPQHRRILSNESLGEDQHSVRPESYSAEAFIFDSYTRDDIKEDEIKAVSPPLSTHPLPRRLSPPPPSTSRLEPESIPPLPPMPSIQPALASPSLQHPLPHRASSLVSPPSVDAPPSRSPSPVSAIHSEFPSQMRPESRPVQTQSISPHSAPPALPGFDPRREKEKDKRGLFKWGGSEKKGKKDQREKEKDAGFFGSLFGSKKRHEEPPASGSGLVHGREAAAALLGESKSYVPPASPQPPSVNNFSRYPIHVERAIYRLSHIKLANPRRALYEQVLISNLMFWYLGVINKTQQQSPSSPLQGQQRQTPTGEAQTVTSSPGPGSPKESEEKEREENPWTGIEQTEKEREPKLALQGQGQMQAQGQGQGQTQQAQSRRGSLTKGAPFNVSPRRAEQPVRGPQYDMQHRAMEVEYGTTFVGARPPAGAGYAASPGAASPAGPTTPSIPMTMLGGTGQSSSSPQLLGIGNTMTTAAVPLSSTLSTSPSRRSRSPPPPAGAALRYATPPPPVPMPVQIPSQNSIPGQSSSTPAPHSQASPLPMSAQQPQGYVDTRPPMRSMSANATQPLGPRGPGRKVLSAHAVLPPGARRPRTAENLVTRDMGEDVPLALWQQQQQQQQQHQQQQQQQQSLINQQPRRR
jgi:Activator of mitotic machinery Cdc14 phosphatase activation C-term